MKYRRWRNVCDRVLNGGSSQIFSLPISRRKWPFSSEKPKAEAVPLADNVAMYMAGRFKSNIRELEGSLIRLIAYASLTGREISLDLAQEVLKDVIDQDDEGGHDREHPEAHFRLLPVEGR